MHLYTVSPSASPSDGDEGPLAPQPSHVDDSVHPLATSIESRYLWPTSDIDPKVVTMVLNHYTKRNE
jgi:hypothetical protein